MTGTARVGAKDDALDSEDKQSPLSLPERSPDPPPAIAARLITRECSPRGNAEIGVRTKNELSPLTRYLEKTLLNLNSGETLVSLQAFI